MKTLNRKTVIIGILLMLAAGFAAYRVLSNEFQGQDIAGTLKHADPRWLALGLAAMLFYSFSEALNINRGLNLTGRRASVKDCLRYALTGFFFSAVTPSATGGQPAQLFLMSRDDINLSRGAFSLLAGALSFQVSSVFLGTCGAVFAWQSGALKNSRSLLWLFAAGFLLNLTSLTFLVCVMFSDRFLRLAGKFLKPETLAEYRLSASLLRNNRTLFFRMASVSLLQLLLYNSIPFFCAKALGLPAAAWLPCTFIQSMLFVSVSSLPLPGATGVTEGGFAVLFGSCFAGSDLAPLLVLSRTVSFIVPLVFSGLAVLAFGVPIGRK